MRLLRCRPVLVPVPRETVAGSGWVVGLDRSAAIRNTLRLAAALVTGPAGAGPDANDNAVTAFVDSVHDGNRGVEIRVTRGVRIPAPFVATAAGFLLPYPQLTATYAALDHDDPAPALTHVGHTTDGAVYLNLEAFPVLCLDGTVQGRARLLATMLTSLGVTPWARHLQVRLSATLAKARELLPTAQVATPAQALLDPSARHGSCSAGPVTVVVCAPTDAGVDQLLTGSHDPRERLLLLLTGPHPSAARLHTTGQHIELADGTRIIASQVDADLTRLQVALTPDASVLSTPAVVSSGTPTAHAAEPAADGDSPTPHLTTDPQTNRTASGSGPTADTTAMDCAREDERPPAEPSPALQVRLLGPVHITGTTGPVSPQQRDLTVFLALHRHGVSADDIATALWPDSRASMKSVRNRVHELRRILEGQISSGPPWSLSDAVTTDWDQFQTLARGSLAEQQRALRLVRGQPLHDLRGEWLFLEGLRAHIDATIVDVALHVVEQSLPSDPAAATAAARAGLLACPWDERLYLVAMRAAAQRGATGEVKTLAAQLRAVTDEELDPDTQAVVDDLLSRARRTAAQVG